MHSRSLDCESQQEIEFQFHFDNISFTTAKLINQKAANFFRLPQWKSIYATLLASSTLTHFQMNPINGVRSLLFPGDIVHLYRWQLILTAASELIGKFLSRQHFLPKKKKDPHFFFFPLAVLQTLAISTLNNERPKEKRFDGLADSKWSWSCHDSSIVSAKCKQWCLIVRPNRRTMLTAKRIELHSLSFF